MKTARSAITATVVRAGEWTTLVSLKQWHRGQILVRNDVLGLRAAAPPDDRGSPGIGWPRLLRGGTVSDVRVHPRPHARLSWGTPHRSDSGSGPPLLQAVHHRTDGVLVGGGDVQDHEARLGDVLLIDTHASDDDAVRRPGSPIAARPPGRVTAVAVLPAAGRGGTTGPVDREVQSAVCDRTTWTAAPHAAARATPEGAGPGDTRRKEPTGGARPEAHTRHPGWLTGAAPSGGTDTCPGPRDGARTEHAAAALPSKPSSTATAHCCSPRPGRAGRLCCSRGAAR